MLEDDNLAVWHDEDWHAVARRRIDGLVPPYGSPDFGDLWYDVAVDLLKVYTNNGTWVPVCYLCDNPWYNDIREWNVVIVIEDGMLVDEIWSKSILADDNDMAEIVVSVTRAANAPSQAEIDDFIALFLEDIGMTLEDFLAPGIVTYEELVSNAIAYLTSGEAPIVGATVTLTPDHVGSTIFEDVVVTDGAGTASFSVKHPVTATPDTFFYTVAVNGPGVIYTNPLVLPLVQIDFYIPACPAFVFNFALVNHGASIEYHYEYDTVITLNIPLVPDMSGGFGAYTITPPEGSPYSQSTVTGRWVERKYDYLGNLFETVLVEEVGTNTAYVVTSAGYGYPNGNYGPDAVESILVNFPNYSPSFEVPYGSPFIVTDQVSHPWPWNQLNPTNTPVTLPPPNATWVAEQNALADAAWAISYNAALDVAWAAYEAENKVGGEWMCENPSVKPDYA